MNLRHSKPHFWRSLSLKCTTALAFLHPAPFFFLFSWFNMWSFLASHSSSTLYSWVWMGLSPLSQLHMGSDQSLGPLQRNSTFLAHSWFPNVGRWLNQRNKSLGLLVLGKKSPLLSGKQFGAAVATFDEEVCLRYTPIQRKTDQDGEGQVSSKILY